MGKNKKVINTRYACISGMMLRDSNRGTAALGYGAFTFLMEKGILTSTHTLIQFRSYNNIFNKNNRNEKKENITIAGFTWTQRTLNVFIVEWLLFMKMGVLLPWTKFSRVIKSLDFVAAINGGDGFSDIYNTETFLSRLTESYIALKAKVPLIMLPQTLGPFKESENFEIARHILTYASKVYIRDNKFVPELDKMGVRYEFAKDLSNFMLPEPWDIDIMPNSIGINVSGLCYSNKFRTLSGQFDKYPELIDRLITHFQMKGKVIYLIPHSYRYGNPEDNNDDMVACRLAYERLVDNKNVIFLDKDIISPQVKYVISKMSFFIGSRMHANFAAIYTGVPLFGLAYSYKFAGAFSANGLDAEKQTSMINNIKEKDIDEIVAKIDTYYAKTIKH